MHTIINNAKIIKFGQLNMRRCQDCADLLHQYASHKNLDVLFVQEPYTTSGTVQGFPQTP